MQIDAKALLNLARTNKDTRRALINETMDKAVWKGAREDCGAIEPPPGWSEAKWVCFLFTSFCFVCTFPFLHGSPFGTDPTTPQPLSPQSCGKANATTDFFILKRLCNPCKKAG